MPKMLAGNGQKGWPLIQRLLVHLFQFMEPFLRNAELGVPVCPFFPAGFHCLLQCCLNCFLSHSIFSYFYPCRFISCIKAHLGCC